MCIFCDYYFVCFKGDVSDAEDDAGEGTSGKVADSSGKEDGGAPDAGKKLGGSPACSLVLRPVPRYAEQTEAWDLSVPRKRARLQ